MNETSAGNRYARALFELADKENCLPEIEALLTALAKLIKEYPEIPAIIQSPVIKETEKCSFIERAIPSGSPVLLKNFLAVLIEKKRFAILDEIHEEFHKLFEQKEGILEVEVISVVSFSKALLEKIKKIFSAKFRWEIRFIQKIDASLIGGFLLRFRGREIDCSFKTRIHEIEQQLLTQS